MPREALAKWGYPLQDNYKKCPVKRLNIFWLHLATETHLSKCLFRKALPEDDLRYFSNFAASSLVLNPEYQTNATGKYFDVWGTAPLWCFFILLVKFSVDPA